MRFTPYSFRDPAAPGVPLDVGPLTVEWQVGSGDYEAYYRNTPLRSMTPGIFVSGEECTLFDPGYPAQLAACPASENVLRGAITDQSGKLISQAIPATVNQYLTLWGTGVYGSKALSLFKPAPLQIGSALISMPITDQALSVTYSGPSGYPGLDQVNFLIQLNAANFPCGTDTKLEADLGFVLVLGNPTETNRVKLPVLVSSAQVPCTP